MVVIRLRVPAQTAKPGPPLSPILGQHQIKVAEFVTQFNIASAGFTSGTPLGVRIHKVGTTWTLQICSPGAVIALGGVRHHQGGKLSPLDVWGSFASGEQTPHRVRTLLGTLKSLGWQLL